MNEHGVMLGSSLVQRNIAVLEFADKIARANETDSVTKLFERLILEFGFSCFGAGRVASERRQSLGGEVWAHSQHEWLNHWNRQCYAKVDPLTWLWRMHPNLNAVTWSEAERLNCGPRPELFAEARGFGLQEGLAVGIKASNGDFAALSMATSHHEIPFDDRPALGFAALLFVSRLAHLHEGRQATKELLTARQRDCLTWAASGKTDWEISQILGLSQRTVQEHLSRCIAKLHATNRTHAVANALLLNLISP